MTDGGLVPKDTPENSRWVKGKNFVVKAINVNSEKGNMDGYLKELTVAMDQFKVRMIIFNKRLTSHPKVHTQNICRFHGGCHQRQGGLAGHRSEGSGRGRK